MSAYVLTRDGHCPVYRCDQPMAISRVDGDGAANADRQLPIARDRAGRNAVSRDVCLVPNAGVTAMPSTELLLRQQRSWKHTTGLTEARPDTRDSRQQLQQLIQSHWVVKTTGPNTYDRCVRRFGNECDWPDVPMSAMSRPVTAAARSTSATSRLAVSVTATAYRQLPIASCRSQEDRVDPGARTGWGVGAGCIIPLRLMVDSALEA